jgi:hypothetical protein
MAELARLEGAPLAGRSLALGRYGVPVPAPDEHDFEAALRGLEEVPVGESSAAVQDKLNALQELLIQQEFGAPRLTPPRRQEFREVDDVEPGLGRAPRAALCI